MTTHHPIFKQFRPGDTPLPEDCASNYLGTILKADYYIPGAKEVTRRRDSKDGLDLPAFDSGYFEWVDVLQSAADASDSYCMVEMGAGFGRWTAIATMAARQRGIDDIRTYSVEAEPTHAQWMRRVFADNQMAADQHSIIEAAIGATRSTMPFFVVACDTMGVEGPRDWYGQALDPGRDETPEPRDGIKYAGHEVKFYKDGAGVIDIPVLPLEEVIGEQPVIDLIDMDIQGAEHDVIAASIDLLNTRVKRLHIGTHSRDIDGDLVKTLSAAGWDNVRIFPCLSTQETAYGTMTFQDGVQTWVNPRLR